MSEDWASAASDVEQALADVGFEVILRRSNTGPTTPWDAAAVVPGEEVTVTILSGNYSLKLVDGTMIKASDRKIMMASSVVPTQNDKLIIAGELHHIVSVMPLAPGGVNLLFKVQARK